MKHYTFLEYYGKLTVSQKDRIKREIIDYVQLNASLQDTARPKVCPLCGRESFIIKKGKQAGKQRYLCKECNHKFTYDTRTITSCLKINREQFIEICLDSLEGCSINYTAARLNIYPSTVFNNRHKFLSLLEDIIKSSNIKLSGTIEADETFILESQKGSKTSNRKARHRGAPANKRGISHEQVCVVTTTDRNDHEIFAAVGLGKPTSSTITNYFKNSIENMSVLYVDGINCYDQLAFNRHCEIKHLKGHRSYNKVEHLNTVNSIHSLIKKQIAFYRGVATKYINRYNSLFVFMRQYQSMDRNEISDLLIKLLRTHKFKMRITDIKNRNLFIYNTAGPLFTN